MGGILLDTPERKRRAAAAFVELGFYLILLGDERIPLSNCGQCPPGDHRIKECPHPPSTCHGYQAGTNDLGHFLELMRRYPRANIGIVTEMSNLVTVDIDVHSDKPKPEAYANVPGINNGWDVYASVLERYKQPWPSTCLDVKTRNEGGHHTWRVPPGTRIKTTASVFGWSVDIKSSRSYIPAPGTVVKDGCYKRLGDVTDPGMAPEWLMHHLKITGHFPEPPKPRAPIRPVSLNPGSDPRAQGWLQEIADGLKNAESGAGHDALLVATCQAAKLVLKGYVTEDDARTAVYDAGVNRPRDAAGQRGYNGEFSAAWRTALTEVGGAR